MSNKDAEVHQFNQKGSSAGAPGGTAGGRNRLTGGVSNTGATRIAGAQGGSKKNGDAMQGSYSADKITNVGGVQMQNQLRKAGKSPIDGGGSENQKGGPWKGFDIKTERGKMSQAEGQRTVSEKQSSKGQFGGLKGQTGAGKGNSYVSSN